MLKTAHKIGKVQKGTVKNVLYVKTSIAVEAIEPAVKREFSLVREFG